MCASPHTCFVFCRKGPEPEEMDKDIILQEKEAEVQSLKPNKLNLLNNCLSVKLSVWLCLCVCVSLSQLRRMQEMIAKMQAQMQKQGDEWDGPHLWETR